MHIYWLIKMYNYVIIKSMKKVIIYDFDGTFYTGKHKFDLVADKVEKNRRKFLPDFTDEEYNEMVKDNPIWLEKTSGADIVDLIYMLKEKYPNKKINTLDFWNWQQQDRYDIVLDAEQLVDVEYIERLCEKYPVYIVSNSSPNHLSYYIQKLGLNETWFKEVISNRFEEFDRTKKHYYYDIMIKENVEPCDVVVIGDSKRNDLAPALLLNMNTIYVDDARVIPYVTNRFLCNDVESSKMELLGLYRNVASGVDNHKIEEFKKHLIEVGFSENELKTIKND